MRLLILAGLILVGPTARLEAFAEEPLALIKKAVRAYGGEENLAKLRIMQTKATGTLHIGADVPFTWETAWQWPDQYKVAAELDAAGQKLSLIQAFDGDKGWASGNGAVSAVEGKKLIDLKAQIHVRRLLTLTPLLTDKAFRLSALDDVMVGGMPAAGVNVAFEGQRDVRLYFDKRSGLLARIDRYVLDDGSMKEILQEEYPSEFKEIDGVQTAMKEVWHRSGAKVAELTYSSVAYPQKIDTQEFARPAVTQPTAADLPYSRTADVIYARKFGVALTMDVYIPKKNANRAAVILVVSGGWVSDNQALNNVLVGAFISEPVKRGYTVFAVLHGSQPKFTIPEAVADLNRAVRYIRHHAKDFQIDPNRVGITGGSAGGHLSLMQGMAGDTGNPKAADPVDRESSRVQAVACLFPPTDFLNYGAEGKHAFDAGGLLATLRPAVDVHELDPKTLRHERITDEKKIQELIRQVSPIIHVTSDDPPTLIVHGDADKLVPIQQAEVILAKLKSAGVTAELVVRKGRGHDFAGVDKDLATMADWFDKYLK